MVAVTCLASLLLRLDDGANTCGLEVVSGVIDVKNVQIKIQNVKKRKNVTKIKKNVCKRNKKRCRPTAGDGVSHTMRQT